MSWIMEHWEVLVPLLGAALALIFDVVLKLRNKELVPIRAYLYVILLVLAAIAFTLASQDRPLIDHVALHLKGEYADGNPYLENLIDSQLGGLKNGLVGKEFSTESLESTFAELNRAMGALNDGDTICAIDYGIPWQKEFKEYQNANIQAALKKVDITRVFIIPQQVLDKPEDKRDLLESMKQQRSQGIKVKFVLEKQLESLSYYRQHDRGMVEFRFKNRGTTLMVEALRYWEAIKRGEPPTLRVVWKPEEISGEDHYFEWLVSPTSSGVRDFDPAAAAPF